MTISELEAVNKQLTAELALYKNMELHVDASKLDPDGLRRTLVAALAKLDKNGLLKRR